MSDEQLISISPREYEVIAQFDSYLKGESPEEIEARIDYFRMISRKFTGFSGDTEDFVDQLIKSHKVIMGGSMMLQEAFDAETQIDIMGFVIDALIKDEAAHAIALDYFNQKIEDVVPFLDSID